MATSITLTTNSASTEYTLATGGRGPVGPSPTVVDAVTNGDANAVSSNAVFDALALKAPLAAPTFTTPVLGAATATTINKLTITQPATSATLTIADGKSIAAAGNISTSSDGYIDTGPDGYINTGASGFIQTGPDGWIATGVGGTIQTGGPINTAAGGSFTTGTGNLTGPNTSGTIALTSDITGTNSGTNTGDETAARIATALNAGTQDTVAADTDRIAIVSPAGGWMLLSTLWTWITGKINTLAKLDAIVADATLARTDAGQTFAGEQAFSSTTRPTSSGTGTPASNSLVTSADVDNKFAKVGAYKSVDQTALTASAYNKITFDVEEYDTHGAFASSTFTAPVAGYVAVTCRLLVSGSTSTDAIAVYKNGAQVKRLMSQNVTTGTLVGGSAVVKVSANDTLEIYYYAQLSKTITGAATISWVQFTMIP